MDPKLYITKSSNEAGKFEYFFGNHADEILFDKKFTFAKPFNEGVAFVYENGCWDVINKSGKSLRKTNNSALNYLPILNSIEPIKGFFYKNYRMQDNLVASVNPKVLYEILTKRFKQKFNFIGDYNQLDNAIAVYKQFNKFSPNGTDLFILEDISFPDDKGELIGIKEVGKKWGFISMENFNNHIIRKYVIKPIYDSVAPFSGGVAKVKYNGRFGFINQKGETIIDFIYDDARSFRGEFAPVAIANHRGNSIQKKISFERRHSSQRWNYISKEGIRNDTYGNNFCRLAAVENIHHGFFGIINDGREKIIKVAGIEEDNYDILRRVSQNEVDFNSNTITQKKLNNFENVFNTILKTHQYLEQLSPVFNISRNLTGPNSLNLQLPKILKKDSLLSVNEMINDEPLSVDSLYFDFDMTQEEMDILTEEDSLERLYGKAYLLYTSHVQKREENKSKDAQEVRKWDAENANKSFDRNDIDFNEDWEWNID